MWIIVLTTSALRRLDKLLERRVGLGVFAGFVSLAVRSPLPVAFALSLAALTKVPTVTPVPTWNLFQGTHVATSSGPTVVDLAVLPQTAWERQRPAGG